MTQIPEGFTQDIPPTPGVPPGFTQDLPPTPGVPPGFISTSSLGEPITPENHGRVAAAAIERANQARIASTGQRLNQNEQVAILDTYRQIAGLPQLSTYDASKQANQFIAEHQNGVLNLARSIAAATENQSVNFVALAVDRFWPGRSTQVR